MKKNVMKTMLAAVCVVAAGMGSFKAYNVANHSEENMLLAEDVEAISACESVGWWNNDGNCVTNGQGGYFCKTDGYFEITDCKI